MTAENLNPTGPTEEERAAEARLNAFFAKIDVRPQRFAHPPLHTVEDSQAFRDSLPAAHQGAHTKNFFLKERRGGLWLAVCQEDRRIRIPDLSKALGAKRFSFGSSDLLWETLGVRPGAVSPFALMNDIDAQAVKVVLDAQMMQAQVLNFHPLHNHATLAISQEDMQEFLAACGHRPTLVDFDALEARAAERDQGRSGEDGQTDNKNMELDDA